MKHEGIVIMEHKSFDIFADSKKKDKKRKADSPKTQPAKKKTKTDSKAKTTKKQSSLFDHFKKSKEKKPEEDKPIVIPEKLLNIVDTARALQNDRTDPEYWASVKKVVSALLMNSAKYRDHLFKVNCGRVFCRCKFQNIVNFSVSKLVFTL